MRIETKRPYLREMTEDDYTALFCRACRLRYHAALSLYLRRGAGARLDRPQSGRYRVFGFGLFAVCLREMGEMIGDCGLTMQNIGGHILPEIGYHIARAHQRQGYAAEAACAVRDRMFETTPFGMLFSYMKQENLPSAATARAAGMHLLGSYTDGEGEQTAVYGISRKEWQAGRYASAAE